MIPVWDNRNAQFLSMPTILVYIREVMRQQSVLFVASSKTIPQTSPTTIKQSRGLATILTNFNNKTTNIRNVKTPQPLQCKGPNPLQCNDQPLQCNDQPLQCNDQPLQCNDETTRCNAKGQPLQCKGSVDSLQNALERSPKCKNSETFANPRTPLQCKGCAVAMQRVSRCNAMATSTVAMQRPDPLQCKGLNRCNAKAWAKQGDQILD